MTKKYKLKGDKEFKVVEFTKDNISEVEKIIKGEDNYGQFVKTEDGEFYSANPSLFNSIIFELHFGDFIVHPPFYDEGSYMRFKPEAFYEYFEETK